jgi:outer membrane lipoprotein-sorting protein
MQLLISGIVVCILAGCAVAQESAPPTSTTAVSEIDAILDRLDARGDSLKGFTADVLMAETDNTTGLSTTRIGKVWIQKLQDNNARMRVGFTKKVVNDQTSDDRRDYVFDKGWLTDRDYRRRTQINRQVLKPGEKLDLLKLGEGPFPLPVGQDKADVHKLFETIFIAGKDGDPKNTDHLQLKPKEGTSFARKFHSIDVWVDRESHMPARIETVDVNESVTQTTDLTNLVLNPEMKDADFVLSKIDEKVWTLHDEPFEQ